MLPGQIFPSKAEAQKDYCLSQQTPGKTCRVDPILKDRKELWCRGCVEAEKREQTQPAWPYGYPFII